MSRRIAIVLAVAGIAAGLTLHAAAEPSAEDAQKYRVSIMTTLRGHIGAASMIVRGLVDDRGQLQHHADGLANGVTEMAHLFPPGSAVGDSEALPAIWEEPEQFADAVEKAQAATAHFQQVIADGGDDEAIGAAFRDVGLACRGCHDRYRVDQD